MPTSVQKKRLGALLMLLVVAIIGGTSTAIGLSLWNPKDRYFIRFTDSVSGLEIGSLVKMRGVNVGQVERISIGRDVESVIVTVALKPGVPVPTDTRAMLTSIGITGLMFVELNGGTAMSPRIKPNTRRSIIKAGASTFESLKIRMHDIGVKLNLLLKNIAAMTSEDTQDKVASLRTDGLAQLVETFQQGNNGKRMKRISNSFQRTTVHLKKLKSDITKMKQQLQPHQTEIQSSRTQIALAVDRMVQQLNLAPLQQTFAATIAAIQRRASNNAIQQVVHTFSTASSRLVKLATDVGRAINIRSKEWTMIKKNLRRASWFLKQLASRFGQ